MKKALVHSIICISPLASRLAAAQHPQAGSRLVRDHDAGYLARNPQQGVEALTVLFTAELHEADRRHPQGEARIAQQGQALHDGGAGLVLSQGGACAAMGH